MLKKQKTAVKSSRVYVNILGVRLNSTSQTRVPALVENFRARGQKFTIFTPNPEIVLEATRDEKYRDILNSATFNIPDGVGLKIVEPSLKIIKGRDLFLDLIKLAGRNDWKVFLLGGLNSEAETASSKLKVISYNRTTGSAVKVMSASGPKLDKNAEPVSERDTKIEIDAVRKINEFRPDILFVGFGYPKQEKWIHKWLPKLNCGGAMAVGGTFSYIAGFSKLPPVWMEKGGLEWFWRLLHEPKRTFRMIKAVIIFPLKVFWYKFH